MMVASRWELARMALGIGLEGDVGVDTGGARAGSQTGVDPLRGLCVETASGESKSFEEDECECGEEGRG